MILSILICRLKSRQEQYKKLREQLSFQVNRDIEVLTLEDKGEVSIGAKRNVLLKNAAGKYVCFIDDDDKISKDYIKQVRIGMEQDVDCCSLVGEITTNGTDHRIFVHSLKYDKYFTENNVYYRPPNHLNVIKKSIANKFRFPMLDHGEDTDWAMQLCDSKALKTEYVIKKTIYFYDYWSEK